jgi:DUF4097 and DUF4098 domain-containing protein YvlB
MKAMKTFLTLGLVLALSLAAHAQNRRNKGASTNIRNGNVTDCGDIQVSFDRKPAITDQSEFTIPAAQVSTLQTRMSNGGIFINGWDRNEFSVKTCKAVPDGDSDGTATLRDIATNRTGSVQISISGPSDRDWTAHLIIRVPRLSTMNIETVNGPLSLRDLAGNIRLTATNGPIALQNVGGVVETTATNGPISLAAASGDHRVNTTNGPVSLKLSGRQWDGPGLEVSTRNGPLSLAIPDGYGSAIAIQTNERSPVNCTASACAGATRSLGSPTIIRMGSGNPVVRVTTSSGPLSISSAKD